MSAVNHWAVLLTEGPGFDPTPCSASLLLRLLLSLYLALFASFPLTLHRDKNTATQIETCGFYFYESLNETGSSADSSLWPHLNVSWPDFSVSCFCRTIKGINDDFVFLPSYFCLHIRTFVGSAATTTSSRRVFPFFYVRHLIESISYLLPVREKKSNYFCH